MPEALTFEISLETRQALESLYKFEENIKGITILFKKLGLESEIKTISDLFKELGEKVELPSFKSNISEYKDVTDSIKGINIEESLRQFQLLEFQTRDVARMFEELGYEAAKADELANRYIIVAHALNISGIRGSEATIAIKGLRDALQDAVTRGRALGGVKERLSDLEYPTEIIRNALFKLRQEYDPLAKAGEEYAKAQARVMRWTARDILRVGSEIRKFGTMSTGVWNRMVESSASLEGTMTDIDRAMEDIFGEIGEAMAPIMEPFVGLVNTLADIFKSLPEPIKVVIGGAVGLFQIFAAIVPVIISIIGTLILAQGALAKLGLAGIFAGKGILSFKMSLLGVSGTIGGLLKNLAAIGMGLMFIASGFGVATKKGAGVGKVISGTGQGLIGLGIMLAPLTGGFSLIISAIGGLTTVIGEWIGAMEGTYVIEKRLVPFMESFGYIEEEAYTMAEDVQAAWDQVDAAYADPIQKAQAFQYRLEELGLSQEEVDSIMISGIFPVELLGEVWDEVSDNIVSKIQEIAESMGVTYNEMSTLFSSMGLDYDELAMIFSQWGSYLPTTMEGLIAALAISAKAVEDLGYDIVITEDAARLLAIAYFDLERAGVTNIINLAETSQAQLKTVLSPAFDSALRDVLALRNAFLGLGQIIGSVMNSISSSTTETIPPFVQGIMDMSRSILDLVRQQQAITTLQTQLAQPFPAPRRVGHIEAVITPLFERLDWTIADWMGLTGYQAGGYVPETGPYLLHKGETVIPASTTTYTGATINIGEAVIRSDTDITRLAEEISRLEWERARRTGVIT